MASVSLLDTLQVSRDPAITRPLQAPLAVAAGPRRASFSHQQQQQQLSKPTIPAVFSSAPRDRPDPDHDDCDGSRPSKRQRRSLFSSSDARNDDPEPPRAPRTPSTAMDIDDDGGRGPPRPRQQKPTSSIPSNTSEAVRHDIGPFLKNHIPQQYSSQGTPAPGQPKPPQSSTRYCYRHRPDLKCRRQANEPTMEELQNASVAACVEPWGQFFC